MKALILLILLLAPTVLYTAGQSITVTNSAKATLTWTDTNPSGTIANYRATMQGPVGTFTVFSPTNAVQLTAFTTNSLVNGSYTFFVSAFGTNGLSSANSTNLTSLLLIPPSVQINLQIMFLP